MLTRIISSVILIPLAVYCLYAGGVPLATLLLIVSLFGLNEFFNLCAHKAVNCFTVPAYVITVIYYINIHFSFLNDKVHRFEFSPILVLGFVFLILWLQFYKRIHNSILDVSATAFAYLYIPVFLSFAMYIRNLEYGRNLLFTSMLLIWAADTFAYFGGMAFGRFSRRLSPDISPKKSVVGVYSGLMASSFFAVMAFRYLNVPSIPFWGYIAYAFILNSFSVIGDLIESQFKRDCEIKDSSGLIPGHGGMLDRIDSLLLVLPFSYYYFIFFLR